MSINVDRSFYNATDVDDAIRVARSLAENGEFDLFRGQIRSFPIQPTIFRPGTDREAATSRLNEFAGWIHTTPELQSLHQNPDAILAVAQHYGFKTPYLDFTTNPEIAGFFAADGELPAVDNPEFEPSCIICASRSVLEESWRDINERSKAQGRGDLVRVVEIDVRNLWRLQAQHGVFLKVYVDTMFLEMFSYFFRIVFPYSGPSSAVKSASIYPAERSHLEVLLEEYFYIENFQQRLEDLRGVFGEPISASSRPLPGEPTAFSSGALPGVLESWKGPTYRAWLNEPDERYADVLCNRSLRISLLESDSPLSLSNRIRKQVHRALKRERDLRRYAICWHIRDVNREPFTLDDDCAEPSEGEGYPQIDVAYLLATLWDGMRRLPYTNDQLALCIGNYVAIAKYGWDGMKALFGETIGVEFSSDMARNRAIVSSVSIKSCIRNDYEQLLTPAEVKKFHSSAYEAMNQIFDPSCLFEFEPFVDLFAREVIPTQLKIRLGQDMLIFSPARLKIFGND